VVAISHGTIGWRSDGRDQFSFAKLITPDVSQAEILPTDGGKHVFDILKETIQSWRDDPQRYVDVVASKKKLIMFDLPVKDNVARA
jgi:hypothetical protein